MSQSQDRWAELQLLPAEEPAPVAFARALRSYLVEHPRAVPWRSHVRGGGVGMAAAYAGLNDDDNDWGEWGVADVSRLDRHLPTAPVPTAEQVHDALVAVCWGDVTLARDIEHDTGYAVVRARRVWHPGLIPSMPPWR